MYKCKYRNKKPERQKGSVTVLVSLLLVPVLLFTGVIIELARVKLYESQAVITADAYANSLLGSFSGELFDMYGLFGYMADEEREEAIAELIAQSFAPQGMDKDDPEYLALVKEIVGIFRENDIDFTTPYAAANVSYDYSVAEAGGKEGVLGTDEIIKSQISQYMALRLPTFMVESVSDIYMGTDTNVQDMVEAVDYVENLANYSDIVSKKTQLDAKLETFFNRLHAYYDDLNAAHPDNVEKWGDDYYRKFGAFGAEDMIHLIGEWDYIGDEITCSDKIWPSNVSVSNDDNSFYSYGLLTYTGWNNIDGWYEYLLDALGFIIDPYACKYAERNGDNMRCTMRKTNPEHDCDDYWVFRSEKIDIAKEKIDYVQGKLRENPNDGKYSGCEEIDNLIDKLSITESNLYKYGRKVEHGNYYQINDDGMFYLLEQMVTDDYEYSMENEGRRIEEEREKIKQNLEEFNAACDKAVADGCSEDIINDMRQDYEALNVFIKTDFDYANNGQRYIDDIRTIIYDQIFKETPTLPTPEQDPIGYAIEASKKENKGKLESVFVGEKISSILDDDAKFFRKDVDKLRTFAEELDGYADRQTGRLGPPTFKIIGDPLYQLEEYQFYKIDTLNLFGHKGKEESEEYKEAFDSHRSDILSKSDTDESKDTRLIDTINGSSKKSHSFQDIQDHNYPGSEVGNGTNDDGTDLLDASYIKMPLYNVSQEEKEWFSIANDDETVLGTVSIDGENVTVTNKLFYEYLRDTFVNSIIKHKTSVNTLLNKGKAVLNEINELDLFSYGLMPTQIDKGFGNNGVASTLSSRQTAIDSNRKTSMVDMLKGAPEYFSSFDIVDYASDKVNTVMLMAYDYTMFSCNTTDRKYIGSVSKDSNEVGKDKNLHRKTISDASQSGTEKNCPALAELADSEKPKSLPSTKEKDDTEPSPDIKADKDKDDDKDSTADIKNADDAKIVKSLYEPVRGRDRSLTNHYFSETSALYYCGDSKGMDLGGSELEYIYGGNLKANDNLSAVRYTLILERLVFNYISTYTIDELNTSLKTVKAAVSAAFTPAAGLITDGVLRLVFAALETNSDMTVMLAGGKVCLIKTDPMHLTSYSMIMDILNDDMFNSFKTNDKDKDSIDIEEKKISLDEDKKSGKKTTVKLPDKNLEEGYGKTKEIKKPESLEEKKENISKGKFPKIELSYKQMLILNMLFFTNKEAMLDRTRDLIDLNVNMKRGHIVREADIIRFAQADFRNESVRKENHYFVTAEQITTIESRCTISMPPFFSSASLNNLTRDEETTEEVQSYLSDERTFSIIRGY